MFSFVKKELIEKILLNYDIDFSLLSIDTQAIIVYLANIFFIICIIFILSILYKWICRW